MAKVALTASNPASAKVFMMFPYSTTTTLVLSGTDTVPCDAM
jgi:hypothetical protein